MAYADMVAARLDMAKYHRQVLIKGMLLKRGRGTGTYQERFVVSVISSAGRLPCACPC
jgi:hypothetical protein